MNENSASTYLVLNLFLKSLALAIPLIMINAPYFVIILVTLIMFLPAIIRSEAVMAVVAFIYTFARPILYIIALIVTFGGPQDFFAIAFYIISAIQAVFIVKNFIEVFGR